MQINMKKFLHSLSICLVILTPIFFLFLEYVLGSGGRLSRFRVLPGYYKATSLILDLFGLVWFLLTFKYFRLIKLKVESSLKYVLIVPAVYILFFLFIFNLFAHDLFKAYDCYASKINYQCEGLKK